ncbi:hypothetical protein PIB30_027140 [Stylosanthes scabra]|uniref:Uncharacterized protein n=1 Tax=Stylosanthes scabra TaxID=79078 RepID=A0ABU6YCT1_9FABA|nr:hypothetical protein [Stylosanthes scabra]
MPRKLRSRWDGPYKVRDVSPYGTKELENESGGSTFKVNGNRMDRKRNQDALKGKEKVRAPPTRMSPRLVALRAPQSPPLKMRTPPSSASPRLAALKDPLLPPSPTSVLIPKKLVVLALATSKPTLPSVTPA